MSDRGRHAPFEFLVHNSQILALRTAITPFDADEKRKVGLFITCDFQELIIEGGSKGESGRATQGSHGEAAEPSWKQVLVHSAFK